jgi:hypothetical protein
LLSPHPQTANVGLVQRARLIRRKEVMNINIETAILIVAIVTAAIAFAALILKVVEVSRK